MSSNQQEENIKHSLPRVTLGAAILVLALALGAAFLPQVDQYEMHEVFLVYDTPRVDNRRDDFYQSLADVLGNISGHTMTLVVASSKAEFLNVAANGVDFVLCPDGLAMNLPPDLFFPLTTGRRKVPRNLRPYGVTVFRKSAGYVDRPWETAGPRTVFGDSLSLVCIGGVDSALAMQSCAFGSDPYNHGEVLQALRLGVFDYALVRQWDADDFFASGLLDSEVWGIKTRTVPMPDIVLMVTKKVPLVERVKWADSLALIGRSGQTSDEIEDLLGRSSDHLGLVGFNLLLEPDFEMVRRNFHRQWPGEAE